MPESEKNNMPPKKRLKIIPVLFIAGFFIIQILAYLLLFIRHFRFIDITISSWLVISLIFAVFIVNTDEDSNIKISWVLLALVFPVFGILLHILSSVARTENCLQADKKTKKNC